MSPDLIPIVAFVACCGALACLVDPALQLASLVTHHLPFDEWKRAVDLARHGKDEVLKVALMFEDRS